MKLDILKKGFFCIIVVFVCKTAFSLPADWGYTVTATNHQILIQSGTVVSINGQTITSGDYLGVFFVNSSGIYTCGGYAQWTGSVTNLAAWGQDSGDDGFEAGESFLWKIWDASANMVYFAIPEYMGSPFSEQGSFVSNGMSGLISLTAMTVPWNYSVTSANHSILISVNSVITIDNIPVIPGDYIGVFYHSQNALHCGGYVLYTGTTTSVAAWGADVGGDGFVNGESFVWKIWNHVTGESWFANPVYMGPPLPNQGNFVTNGMSGIESLSAYSTPVPWNFTVTSSNHTILIPQTTTITVDSIAIDPGDYIGVFYDSSGAPACGGYICWQEVTTSLAAWAQDNGDDGFAPGEDFIWKIWKHSTGEEFIAQPTYMGSPMPNQGNFAQNGMSGIIALSYLTPVVPWQYVITSTNHSILVQASAQITIDGIQVTQGDYIGVFYNQNGTPACGGYFEWTGQTTAISAWGDDIQTTQKEGFDPNESFMWKIWKASSDQVFDAAAVYLPNPPMPNSGHFASNGLSGISSLTAWTSETHYITFPQGWSIFSTYIHPFDSAIINVFSSIVQHVDIIKDGLGNIYWPVFNVDNINNMIIGNGYQIKTNASEVLGITGMAAIPEITPINLLNGWNIIGYLRRTPSPVENEFSSVVSDIIIIKDGFGNIYWPVFGVNNIIDILPGYGYQLKTTALVTLFYSPN